MKPEKPKRSVANMSVLKDIRGLLSAAQEGKASMEAELEEETELKAEIARYKGELERYRELAQRQQEHLERLRKENEELVASPNLLRSGSDEMPASPNAKVEGLNREIAQLEARKCELCSALSEVEGLLQLKSKELLKRIARVYQEVGESGIAIEFTRAADGLEVAENFAHLLQALLRG
jgi:chromosome segregation ATPase